MRIRLVLVCFCLQSVIAFATPVIVLPDHPKKLIFPPGETQAYAADFLNEIIAEAIGKKLKIIPESRAGTYPERIFIGSTNVAVQLVGKLNCLKPESLVVRSNGRDLILCGEVSPDGFDRGTLFAVYEYLERALGVRWYYPDDRRIHPDGFGTMIPRCTTLKLSHWNIYDWPRFRSREGGSVIMRGRRNTSGCGILCYVLAVLSHPAGPTIPRSDGTRFIKTRTPNILRSEKMEKHILMQNIHTVIIYARISPEFWNRCFAIWTHSIMGKRLPMHGGRALLWERKFILRSTTA